MHHKSHDQHLGRGKLAAGGSASRGWGFYIQGRRSAYRGGIYIQVGLPTWGRRLGRPLPELGKRVVRILLDCFLILSQSTVHYDKLQEMVCLFEEVMLQFK